MSRSKSKTTQSSQESFNRTTTPTAPSQITTPIFGVAERVNAIGESGQPIVTGASPLQQQAFGQAQNLTASPNYGGANLMTILGATQPSERASAATFSREGLNERMNPFLEQVMGAFTGDFDVQAARRQAMDRAQQSQTGGMWNSNNALLQAQREGELARARGAGIAGIQSDAYRTALGSLDADNARQTQVSLANAQQSQNDLLRLLSGGSQFANLGQAQNADQRANIGLIAGLGEQQRGIANEQAQADLQREAQIAQIINLLTGTGAVVGQNQQGTGTGTSTGTTRQSGISFGFNPTTGFSFGG